MVHPLKRLSKRSAAPDYFVSPLGTRGINTESTRFDIVDLKGADVVGRLTSLAKDYPIMTSYPYGKGRAIYVGLPAKGEVLGAWFDDLIEELGIRKGPEVPSGVKARQTDATHFLYLNVSDPPKNIPLTGQSRSILYDQQYNGNVTIAPYEADCIEIE